jgi:uncharacterized protein
MHALFLLPIRLTSLSIHASEPSPAKPQTVAPARATFLVIYRPGPAWPKDAPVSTLPLQEHGRYLLGLYSSGLLKIAGPFTDDTGGAVMLEVANEAEAKAIVENDPAVKSDQFLYELRPWSPVPWERFQKEKPVQSNETR